MIFPSTTDKLQLITSSTADMDVIVDYADMDNTTKAVTVGRQLTKITTATTTDIMAAPAAGFTRKAKYVNINNVHASASNTVTIQYNANATLYKLETYILLAGERASYVEGRGFRPFDTQGREDIQGVAGPTGAATIAQIASHSADTYYLGLQMGNRIQAGTVIRWSWRSSKTAGTATPIYTIRTGTAGTTADTARVTLTGVAQTAVVDNGYFVVEAAFRAVGAAAILTAHQALQHSLAATGFANVASPTTQGTSASFDATGANVIVGLSVNPGTAGAWVTELVTLDATNLLN